MKQKQIRGTNFFMKILFAENRPIFHVYKAESFFCNRGANGNLEELHKNSQNTKEGFILLINLSCKRILLHIRLVYIPIVRPTSPPYRKLLLQ